VYNHCSICNIPIYFCDIHLKYLLHTSETSETLKTYACNMRFQQNMAVRRAEHSIAGSRLCDCGGEGGWQWAGSCAALGDRTWRQQQQSGGAVSYGEDVTAVRYREHAAAVERKAGGRRGREGGVREPRLSRSRSGCVIFLICGDWRRADGADRNGLLDVGSTNRGFRRGRTFDSQHYCSLIP
jgi:hypothetical protein